MYKIIVSQGKKTCNYFLKQAWLYNKRSFLSGQPMAVDTSRIIGEVYLISYLNKLWPAGVVPRVYFFDKQVKAFLMSDVSKGGKLLIDEFNKNKVHPEIASTLARLLAMLHTKTYKKNIKIGSSKSYEKKMKNFLFGKKWWGYALGKFFKQREINNFYKEVKKNSNSLVWGDPINRNIFVKIKNQVSLVDFDFAINYDPMVDLGVLQAHWLWMKEKGGYRLNRDCQRFLNNFDKYYWPAWENILSARQLKEYKNRADRWSGLYLLSRTDGRSGSYFKQWPAWEKRVRKLGLELFGKTEIY
ncbi:MAG: phosphotransferase [Patescibacteria group bacterium]